MRTAKVNRIEMVYKQTDPIRGDRFCLMQSDAGYTVRRYSRYGELLGYVPLKSEVMQASARAVVDSLAGIGGAK